MVAQELDTPELNFSITLLWVAFKQLRTILEVCYLLNDVYKMSFCISLKNQV